MSQSTMQFKIVP